MARKNNMIFTSGICPYCDRKVRVVKTSGRERPRGRYKAFCLGEGCENPLVGAFHNNAYSAVDMFVIDSNENKS